MRNLQHATGLSIMLIFDFDWFCAVTHSQGFILAEQEQPYGEIHIHKIV